MEDTSVEMHLHWRPGGGYTTIPDLILGHRGCCHCDSLSSVISSFRCTRDGYIFLFMLVFASCFIKRPPSPEPLGARAWGAFGLCSVSPSEDVISDSTVLFCFQCMCYH